MCDVEGKMHYSPEIREINFITCNLFLSKNHLHILFLRKKEKGQVYEHCTSFYPGRLKKTWIKGYMFCREKEDKVSERESERNGVRDTRNEGICIKLVIFSSATVRWWRIQSYHRDCKKVCTGDLLTSKGYSKHSFFLLYRSKRVAEDLRSKH